MGEPWHLVAVVIIYKYKLFQMRVKTKKGNSNIMDEAVRRGEPSQLNWFKKTPNRLASTGFKRDASIQIEFDIKFNCSG